MSQSIVTAYQNKYEDNNEDSEDSEIQIVFVKRKNHKVCNLILDNCFISETGCIDKVADICSRVTECDLAYNNISDWNEVFRLLDVGKHIKFLNLSNNKLGKCEHLPENQYPFLQCLALSGNDNQWDNLLSLLPSFPSLSHLNIGHSKIASMPCPADLQFPNLTELNLIENSISCFDDVSELATMFINLHTLVLSDNPVISFGDNQQVVERFEKLAKLHVNNITINSWDEVSKLRWFPALSDVRMVHWDLFGDMNEKDRRKMLGALLPNAHLINGAPIPDREAAERWYMRRCQGDGNTETSRYKELYEKYGELPAIGDIKLGGTDETITLKLCVPEKGVEVEKSFSIYDTYKTIMTGLEKQLKEYLSLNIYLHKTSDDTVYTESRMKTSSHNFGVSDKEAKPGEVKIKQHWQMLYQVINGLLPLVKPEEGDSLVFRVAHRFECRSSVGATYKEE